MSAASSTFSPLEARSEASAGAAEFAVEPSHEAVAGRTHGAHLESEESGPGSGGETSVSARDAVASTGSARSRSAPMRNS
jgi:hypothetical protein